MDIYLRKAQIAENIIELSKRELLLSFRFFNSSLDKLKFHYDYNCDTIGTDGKNVYYNPNYIIKSYRSSVFSINKTILHIIYHCLLKHPFVTSYEKKLWDTATDIAVSLVLDKIDNLYIPYRKNPLKEELTKEILENTKYQTAQSIYKYLITLSSEKQMTYTRLYIVDDHSLWFTNIEQRVNKNTIKKVQGENNVIKDANKLLQFESSIDEYNPRGFDEFDMDIESLIKEWSDINRSIQMDMETFSKKHGNLPGEFLRQLKLENRDRYDYSKFLKKFSVLREEIKIDEDSFDYIFYSYGLENYGNLALIEPLEYKDSKKIYEFAIVIDTSGSVINDEVKKFLNKTYSILKSRESFDRRMKLHIIQCDASVQDDVVIHNVKEFEQFIDAYVVKGGGGTDFRPAFQYIDELIENKQFTNLKGIIYFTDGYGIYPTQRPNYETAFIFLKDNYTDIGVPPWAIKLILDSDDI